MSYNLLITGSRTITNSEIVNTILDMYSDPFVLITGGANGVDRLAIDYFMRTNTVEIAVTIGAKTQDHIRREAQRCENNASQTGITNILTIRPRYSGSYDRSAPIIRNKEMVKLLDPNRDKVIAIWDGKSNGTLYTIDEANRRNIETVVYTI